MADSAETFVRVDPVTGEKKERRVFNAADKVAAKFAGFAPKSSSKAAGGSTAKTANGGGAAAEKAADSK